MTAEQGPKGNAKPIENAAGGVTNSKATGVTTETQRPSGTEQLVKSTWQFQREVIEAQSQLWGRVLKVFDVMFLGSESKKK